MVFSLIVTNIPTFFIIFTIPIYIMFLAMLYKYRKDETLSSPFFKLIFSIGVADIFSIFDQVLGNALPGSGLVSQIFFVLGGISSRLYYLCLFLFGMVQVIGVVIVAINRYTAYMAPMRHKLIWSNKITRKLIIFQWVAAVILASPIFFYFDFEIGYDRDNKTVLMQWADAAVWARYNFFMSGVLSFTALICILTIYTAILVAALWRRCKKREQMSQVEKQALKMALVGFICSAGLMIYVGITTIRLVLWNFFHVNMDDYFSSDVFWMIFNSGRSIFLAVNPYALFIFSSIVRRRFAEMYFCFLAKKTTPNSNHQEKNDDPIADDVRLRYLSE